MKILIDIKLMIISRLPNIMQEKVTTHAKRMELMTMLTCRMLQYHK